MPEPIASGSARSACGIAFTDADVVNIDDWIPAGSGSNPNRVRPFLLHDHGFVVAVVFADCKQDAIDAAVNEGRLDRYAVAEAELCDYPDEDGLTFLGNAGEPFDIDTLSIEVLPNPPLSFATMFSSVFPLGHATDYILAARAALQRRLDLLDEAKARGIHTEAEYTKLRRLIVAEQERTRVAQLQQLSSR